MNISKLLGLLANIQPDELRQRIAEIDRERCALMVLLRAAAARQLGRDAPQRAQREEARRAQ